MFSESLISSISEELDKLYNNDSNILTLACIRIDGPIFYLKTREKTSQAYEAKLSSLNLLIKNLASHLLELCGDSNTRFISFGNLDKKISLGILDFMIIFVETNSSGNAKGIAKSIASLM